MLKNKDITAIILAGGDGRRMMGCDKGLIPFANKPMVAHVIERIKGQCGQLLISANRHKDIYADFACPVISDIESDIVGPLTGLHSVHKHVTTDYCICTPCDAPLLNTNLVTELLKFYRPGHIIIPQEQSDKPRLQPLFSLIPTALLSSINGSYKSLTNWMLQQPHVLADFPQSNDFANINSPVDLYKLQKQLQATQIPLLGFCGDSGSGKTTLINRLIQTLAKINIRIAVIKHAHHKVDVDKPGKDSHAYRVAGAKQVALITTNQWFLMTETDERIDFSVAVNSIDKSSIDLILAEGFKNDVIPKFVFLNNPDDINRHHLEDETILGFITNKAVDITAHTQGCFITHRDDIDALSKFVEKFIKQVNYE